MVCRLAAVAPKRRYGAPRMRKVGDTAGWKPGWKPALRACIRPLACVECGPFTPRERRSLILQFVLTAPLNKNIFRNDMGPAVGAPNNLISRDPWVCWPRLL